MAANQGNKQGSSKSGGASEQHAKAVSQSDKDQKISKDSSSRGGSGNSAKSGSKADKKS